MQRGPMNAAEIMDKVVDVYKESFWKQIAFAAVFYIVAFIGGIIMGIAGIFFIALVMGAVVGTGFYGANFFAIVGLFALVLMLPLILFWQAATATGHIVLAKQALYGFKIKIFDRGLLKILLRVITALLAQIIFAIPYFIVAIASFLVFVTMVDNFFIFESLLAFFGLTGLIAAIGFGYLAYSHVFSLSVPVAVFEDRYFFGTIRRSWELVKTDFWRMLGIRMLWFGVIAIITSSLQAIFSMINSLVGLLAGTIPVFFILAFFVMMFTGFVGPALATMLTSPMDGLMQATIYFNQRVKNEGFDVEMRLDKLLFEAEQ